MEPTYSVNDQIIINKLAYLSKNPARGDIVLLDSPVADKGLIKRIIGLPGEELFIENKRVYINGYLLEEDYAQYTRADDLLVGDNIDAFTIPQNQYFVMGDNRDVSRDSRDWLEDEGLQSETILMRNIHGKVFVLY
jgi:signal peptidase I